MVSYVYYYFYDDILNRLAVLIVISSTVQYINETSRASRQSTFHVGCQLRLIFDSESLDELVSKKGVVVKHVDSHVNFNEEKEKNKKQNTKRDLFHFSLFPDRAFS